MKILLLNPPGENIYLRDYFCSKTSKAGYIYHPVDLLVLSGILYDFFEIKVIDAVAEKKDKSTCLREIGEYGPDAIIFLSGIVSFDEDFNFFSSLKKENHLVKLIGIGDLFWENPEKILSANGWLDAILLDFSTIDIRKYLGGKVGFKNIIYREEGKIINSGISDEKIFKIPVPRHELFLHKYYSYPFVGRPFSTVLTSFGCPYQCEFCMMNRIGYKIRPIDDCINEIIYINKLGIKNIYFADQTFTADKDRVRKFCSEIIGKNIKINWVCFSRVDAIDDKMIKLMKKAGCRTIMFGVESGSQKTLDNYKKNITLSQVEQTFKLCHNNKVKTAATFILGLPGEGEKEVVNTINFAKKLGADFSSFNIAVPRPNTVMREYIKRGGSLIDQKMDQSGKFISFSASELNTDQLKSLQKRAYREFYFRPGFLLKHIFDFLAIYNWRSLLSGLMAMIKKNFE